MASFFFADIQFPVASSARPPHPPPCYTHCFMLQETLNKDSG